MEFLIPLVTLGAVQLLAVMSPGQSFVVASKLALSSGPAAGVSASLGMGVGSVIWALSAIGGVALLLEQAAWLYQIFKVAGGLYLLFLAVMLWRHAPDAVAVDTSDQAGTGVGKAFMLGLATQLANPKVIVFFGSIFVALLPAGSPLWVYAASLVIAFCNETLWYALVSVLFSASRPRAAYLRLKTWIDRVMALFLGAIGGRLIYDALDR